jgi:MFS superfamily sulfate permease-like transporter
MIPIASLAAVLVYTGYKLVQLKVMRSLWQIGRSEMIIYAITLISVVSTSLLEGVLIGFVIASFRLLYMLSKLYIEQKEIPERNEIHLTLKGSATFINLPTLSAQLEQLPSGWDVHVHIDDLSYIDHACLELLKQYEARYYNNNHGGCFAIEWDELNRKMRQEPVLAT